MISQSKHYEFDGNHFWVTVIRADEQSKWCIEVDVQRRTGEKLPKRIDGDSCYSTLEEALDAGLKLGKSLLR